MAAPIGAPRVRLPASAKAGEIIEIRTLVSHVMETGLRRDVDGKPIPRDIIKRFEARFEGQLVFAMDLAQAISATPYIAFPFKVEKAGSFAFSWENEAGESKQASAELKLA
jgi:sulfur-oxidizing protein SoxZ